MPPTTCSRQINSIIPLISSGGYWWCRNPVDTFSGYGFAVSAQTANAGHITVALESNLCDVFGFLGHVQSDEGAFLITKVPQRWAGSQGLQRTLHIPCHPRAPGILQRWNASSKINSERILTLPPLTPSWSIHFYKAVWSLNAAVSRKAISWVHLHESGKKTVRTYFGIWRFRFDHS